MVQFEQQKAARQQLEPATGPSRNLTEPGGPMSHLTQTTSADASREPVSLGDALAEVLPTLNPDGVLHAADVAVHIGWGSREGSLCTVGELRSLISNLPDDMLVTPVVERWRRNGTAFREFAGLRIAAGDEL